MAPRSPRLLPSFPCLPRLVALLALGLPSLAWADEAPTRPEKHESDAKPPSSVRLPTLFGGLGFTAGVYGLNVGTSYLASDAGGITQLRVPVAGPWMAIANNTCPVAGCDIAYYFRYVYFAVSGLAQAGGLGVALESILVPTAKPGELPPPRPAPASQPAPGPREEAPPPSPSPDSAPPSQPGGNGKPMFYLPMPVSLGKDGVGVMMGGVF